MIDITIYGVSATVLTYIIAEVTKRAGIDNKYIPLTSIVSAILIVCLGTWTFSVEAVITGIVIGAITSGVYDNFSKGTKIVKGE